MKHEHFDLISLLLRHGADVNAHSDSRDGRTVQRGLESDPARDQGLIVEADGVRAVYMLIQPSTYY